MSAAQILEEIKSYPTPELESLEHSIRLERLRRSHRGLSAEETRLFEIINQPMPRIERFRELEPFWEAGTLSDDERAELLEIVEAREILSAERIDAVRQLAELRGTSFEALWQQIMGETPPPRLVLG